MSERSSSLRNGIAYVTLVAASASGAGALGSRLAISRPEKDRSSTERMISDSMYRAFGSRAAIECVPDGRLGKGVMGQLRTGNPNPSIDIVNSLCDRLEEIHADPSGHVANEQSAEDIKIASHEASHFLGNGNGLGQRNEALTDCFAVQRVPATAQGLGMTSLEATRVGNTVAANYKDSIWVFTIPKGCEDGGKYDLDPNTPGVFPNHEAPLPPADG